MTMTDETNDTTAAVPTGVQLTALDPAFQQDPYPVLDELRSREPVHHDTVLRRYFLTAHDDIDAVLRDRSLSADPRKAAPDTFMQMFTRPDEGMEREPSILFLDPPDHTRLRGLVNKAFTPRAIESMAPRIQQIIDHLLDAVDGSAGFDLIASFAGPLPTIVIAEMLGVDPADRDDFKRWSDTGVMGFDPLLSPDGRQQVMESGQQLDAYLQQTIEERRRSPRPDLISSMIAAEEAGDQMASGEIVTMCALLLAAGNVTTTDLIGNGVLALLQHPGELEKLREDSSLIKNAVEEMLRFDGPVTQTGRIPLEDVTVHGCSIAAGQSIVTEVAAANRDPAVYPDPHRFDISRDDTHHHAFGGGAHYCLGAPLARLEGAMAIASLVERFPKLRLADAPLQWRRLPGFRGLLRLDVLV